MNSTDSKPDRWAGQDQFVADFLAIGSKIRAGFGDLFPVGPDEDSDTYYSVRAKTRMERADFEVSGLSSSADLAEALSRLWEAEGLEALSSFAPRFAAAAQAYRAVEQDNDEVSPLIYVMF